MRQYSFKVLATRPVSIPDPLILLDRGLNVFTVVTSDVDLVKDMLDLEGASVLEVNALEQERVTVEDMLLPGEPISMLGPYGELSKKDP